MRTLPRMLATLALGLLFSCSCENSPVPPLPDGSVAATDGSLAGDASTLAGDGSVVESDGSVGGLTIVTESLPPGTLGVAYSQQLEAQGGTAPIIWSLESASVLPTGVSLDAAGKLSGTPAEAGDFALTVTAKDSAGAQASRSYTLTITASGELAVQTASLPDGTVGLAYSQSLAAVGGTPPFTWSAVAGSLPPGVALSAAGLLAGTPTAEGTYDFTVVVADSASPARLASASLSIKVKPPSGGTLVVTTTALADGIVGAAYAATLAAGGGTQPYQWAVSSGALPAGLALAADGKIAGVPTTAGTALFTVEVKDSSSPVQVASARLGITVLLTSGSLHVTTASLPGGTLGVAYSAKLDAVGGAAPYAWSLASGALPGGLALSADGRITGVPSTVGAFPLVVQVTDNTTPVHDTAQKPFILEVATGPLSIVTVSLPKAVVSVPYHAAVEASGGQPPYSWRIVQGDLPAGIALDASTGAVTGTPTAVSTSSFTVQASDSSSPQKTAQQALSIAVTANSSGLVITTVSLPDAVNGVFYSFQFTAAGGVEPYTWSLMSASNPPAGLTLSSDGVLSGTPTASGSFSLNVRVNDSDKPVGQFNQNFGLAVRDPLRVSTASLPAAKVGTAYASSLAATGGATPYAFSVLSGSLPPGLSLSATGALSGTPTAEGVYGFVAQATDASSPRQIASTSLSIAVGSALSLDTTSLPDALVGVDYDAAAAASGGVPPYSWSVTSGSLPAGLQLDAAAGRLHGTPTAAVDATFTLRVSDSAGQTASRPLTLKVTVATSLVIATATVPGAVAGAPYSAALSAAGGSPPYVWSVSAGALPQGLALSAATGIVSGTPAAAGAASFTVRVVDTSTPQQSASRDYTLAVVLPLSIATSSLPAGITGTAYDAALTAAGGTAPYAWSLSGGALPQGLALDPITGHIAGAPAAAGSFGFTVKATDASAPQQSATATLTIVISPALAITTAALADAAIGTAYSTTLEASGGTKPYLWSMSSGSLPPGVALDPATGKLSGTPTASGTFAFTASASDASTPKQTASKGLSIVVRDSNALAITTTSLPSGVAAVAYSAALAAVGGTTPYTWAISVGALPPGLWLDTATGAIAGSPSATGSYAFTAQVSDSAAPRQTASRAFAIVIVAPLSVATASLPGGVVGSPYAAALSASGGVPPLTWSVASGALPAGLGLNATTGVISGTPTAAGTSAFTLSVHDSSGPALTATANLSIAVVAPLAITTASLAQARVGVTYAEALHATGGTSPYAWSIGAGSLPAGLSLDTSLGTITGVPTAAGTFAFTVTVRDASNPQLSASRDLAITAVAELVITTTTLPGGSVGAAYSAALAATGGTPPYTWSVTGGQPLPAGLALDAATGVISGTPTTAASYTFNVQVSDSSTPAIRVNKSLTIVVAASGSLVVVTASLPDGVHEVAYPSTTLAASGGTLPYTWAVTGTLPPGLSLNATTGAITGTPTAMGSYDLTFTVTDAASATASRAFTLRVADLLEITTASPLPDAQNRTAYSVTLTAIGGTLPYTWSLASGQLPSGLALDPATGKISGSPTQSGNRTFTVRVTDSGSPAQQAEKSFTLRVN